VAYRRIGGSALDGGVAGAGRSRVAGSRSGSPVRDTLDCGGLDLGQIVLGGGPGHLEQGAFAQGQALGDHHRDHGEKRVPEAGHVDQHDRPVVEAELAQGEHLQQLLEGAEAGRQGERRRRRGRPSRPCAPMKTRIRAYLVERVFGR
jgi:hypothetical protein